MKVLGRGGAEYNSVTTNQPWLSTTQTKVPGGGGVDIQWYRQILQFSLFPKRKVHRKNISNPNFRTRFSFRGILHERETEELRGCIGHRTTHAWGLWHHSYKGKHVTPAVTGAKPPQLQPRAACISSSHAHRSLFGLSHPTHYLNTLQASTR